MFADNIFHLYSVKISALAKQYLLAAAKAFLYFIMVVFGHSQHLVKVRKRLQSWFNTEEVHSELKPVGFIGFSPLDTNHVGHFTSLPTILQTTVFN